MSKQLVKDGRGRPSDYGPEIVIKLIECFRRGLSIYDACIFSEISRETYYRWLETKPGFSDKMEAAQRYPNAKAREVLMNHIEAGDKQAAQFYLNKRDSEFKDKVEVDHHNADLEEHRKKIKGFLDDDTSGDVQPETDQETPAPVESVSDAK